jgi:hypothetical protein
MKYWTLILTVFLLTACNVASTNEPSQTGSSENISARFANLPDVGKAPELTNEVWLNTDQPLQLANLRGKVVLLEMWTFG